MELTFSDLRKKEVINIGDGARLGRVCDIVFSLPKYIVQGIVVPGCAKLGIFKSAPDLFISMQCIVKIGEDVILVDTKKSSGGKTGCTNECKSLYANESCPEELE